MSMTITSWSEIADLVASMAAIVTALRTAAPRVKNQSIFRYGGCGVPSGRIRSVADRVLAVRHS